MSDKAKEREMDAFFAALGRSIASWVWVEDGLYLLFEKVVRAEKVGLLMSAFHAVQHSQSKISMVDAAIQPMKERFPEFVAEWNGLKKRCDRLLRRRNEFAHFQVFIHTHREGRKDRVVMRPSMLDGRYYAGVKEYIEHPISGIQEIGERISELSSDIESLAYRVPMKKAKQS